MSNHIINEISYSDSDFQWFIPSTKASEYVITIPNDTNFNFNQKLLNKIPKKISIGVSPDGKKIRIKESSNGYNIPKSGSIKASEIIKSIKDRGIRLPVRYTVHHDDDHDNDYVEATFIQPVAAPNTPKQIPKKPRTTGLKSMLISGGNI